MKERENMMLRRERLAKGRARYEKLLAILQASSSKSKPAKQADYFPLAGSILSPPKSKHHLFFSALALLDPVTSA
jgi:hypothetical protein